MRFDINELETPRLQQLLQSAVAPRPIGLVSTIDSKGHPNLAPFSFFGLFSVQPPVVIFSPSRRLSDVTVKHTLENLHEVPECVVHLVEYDLVGQMNLCAFDYPPSVNEFEKAGLTMKPAALVRPFLAGECRIKMECRVRSVQPLGEAGGAGNLVVCDILMLHIADTLLNEEQEFNLFKYSPVARLGGDWYTRVDASSVFSLEKPRGRLAAGMDALPDFIKGSAVFTSNQRARLAGVAEVPQRDPGFCDERVQAICTFFRDKEREKRIQQYAAELLESGKVQHAWQALLSVHERMVAG